jgi:hypothetical protein
VGGCEEFRIQNSEFKIQNVTTQVALNLLFQPAFAQAETIPLVQSLFKAPATSAASHLCEGRGLRPHHSHKWDAAE